jgi:hypothetical protein
MKSFTYPLRRIALACATSLLPLLPVTAPAWAADHGDGPRASNDQAADIADVYFFLDPNDPTMAVIIGTTRGFIVPSEATNFGIFDPGLHYRFEIENTGDAVADRFYDITFSPRVSTSAAQIATINVFNNRGRRIASATAPATNPSLASTSPAPVITSIGGGVSFFAGEVDDPFFFDIPGFNRFVASVLGGSPDAAQLERGRDSFAGYNAMAIALRVPVASIKGATNVVGVDYNTLRTRHNPKEKRRGSDGNELVRIDRMATPAVNVALVPFPQKDAYNSGNPVADARGTFAPGIVQTLTALGTNSANIGALAGIAVTKGDYVRMDVSVQNMGPGGGNNAGAGFPNGRRLGDDVIDTELFIITNGLITAGDHVDGNDVPRRDAFPFLGASQQPRVSGTVDDNTRN